MSRALKLKKGDTVLVQKGKDRGKRGKIVRLFPRTGKIVVEGVNEKTRHTRPRRMGQKGQRISVLHPIWAANALVVCPSCSKPTRVGYRLSEGSKSRVCKKCGGNLS